MDPKSPTPDTVEQGRKLLELSERQNREDHARALETAKQALSIFQTVGDGAGIASAYAHIGQYSLAQSDLFQAEQSYREALKLWGGLNNNRQQARVLVMLGYIENRRGEWSNAFTFYTQAQSLIDETTEPFEMGLIANGLGDIFEKVGLTETSVEQYQRALNYFRRATSRDDPNTLASLGNAYYLLEDYPQALSFLKQVLASPDVEPDSLYAALSHERMAKVYLALGKYDAALENLNAALPVYVRAGNQREAARVHGLLGQLFQKQGKVEQSRKNYLSALKSFQDLADRFNQAAVCYAIGGLELEQNELNRAEAYLKQAIELTEDMRRIPTSNDLMVAFSAAVHQRYQSYIDCLMRKHANEPSRHFDVQALQTSEMARGRALAELLHSMQTNPLSAIDPELGKREEFLRQTLRVKEEYRVSLLAKVHKKEELDALLSEISTLENQYKQVVEVIRQRYPAYDQMSRPEAWTLQQIQERVITDDETVLLEYSLGHEKSYVWAITNKKLMSYELPSAAEIESAVARLYELLQRPPGPSDPEAISEAVQKVTRMVLAPAVAELSNRRRVVIVAGGALNYVPFQILTPFPNNEPLAANYEVVNAPSASILGQLREEAARRKQPAKVLAAFGDPAFLSPSKSAEGSDNLATVLPLSGHQWRSAIRDIEPDADSVDPSKIQPLFYARQELANLRNLVGEQTFVATGFDASRARLERMDLSSYAILHFATHGILDPKRPERSGFFLSMVGSDGRPLNGFIGLEDVYRLRAPVSLVVLSACRTGLGKDVRGEGLIGLTRGFMYAGASSVVASLWKVDDEATAELMKRFYSNMLQREMTPAEALRAAQNSIRQEPGWSSPYYWAAFTLQGDFHDRVQAKPLTAEPTPNLIIVGAVLLILILWMYVSYHRMRAKLGGGSIRG